MLTLSAIKADVGGVGGHTQPSRRMIETARQELDRATREGLLTDSEVVSPYYVAHYVAGDARGSHHMPLMPAAVNTAITGPYCLPLVACAAYSVTRDGKLSERVDVFGNPAWDATRLKAQEKADEMRRQGFVGPAMLPVQELEYSAFRASLEDLEERFETVETLRAEPAPAEE